MQSLPGPSKRCLSAVKKAVWGCPKITSLVSVFGLCCFLLFRFLESSKAHEKPTLAAERPVATGHDRFRSVTTVRTTAAVYDRLSLTKTCRSNTSFYCEVVRIRIRLKSFHLELVKNLIEKSLLNEDVRIRFYCLAACWSRPCRGAPCLQLIS